MSEDLGRVELDQVRDYVAGTLPQSAAEAFELRMLGDPALAREVELVQTLREGLAELQQRGEFESAPASTRMLAWWQRPQAALAATCVLGVSLATSAYLASQQISQQPAGGAAASAPLAMMTDLMPVPAAIRSLRLEHTRSASGGAAQAIWRASAVPELVELQVDVSLSTAQSFTAELLKRTAAGEALVLRLPRLAADTQGDITLTLLSAMLPPGMYELRVHADQAPDDAQRFAILVQP